MAVGTPTVQSQGLGQVNADALNTYVSGCVNVAAARTVTGVNNQMLYLQGYVSMGDGGQGPFAFNATSTAADDNGITVIAPTSSATGRWIRLPNTSQITAPTFMMDGGGAALATGFKGFIPIPFAFTITGALLLSDQSCTATVDIWASTLAAWDPPTAPTSADSICASALPTITAGTSGEDTTLTGWTKSFPAGTILAFNLNANDSATLLTLSITVVKA